MNKMDITKRTIIAIYKNFIVLYLLRYKPNVYIKFIIN